MKHSIKNQFMALLDGLQVPEPNELIQRKPPQYFREIGDDFRRLATIGWQTVEAMKQKEEDDKDTGRN